MTPGTTRAQATSRRDFIRCASVLAGSAILTPVISLAQAPHDSLNARFRSRNMVDKGPPVSEELVFEFVHKSHFNLDIVKQLLTEEPQLVHASWDWGGGDFETGLGAASHMGNREIALYLIDHGARTNLFAATMLGHLAIVRGFLEAYPDMLHTKGPHGIPLVAHAEKGGHEATEVLAYLRSLEQG